VSAAYSWLIAIGLGSTCILLIACVAVFARRWRRRHACTTDVWVIRCPEYGPDSLIQLRISGRCFFVEDCSLWPGARCNKSCVCKPARRLIVSTSADAGVAADV
jgi:hypothetical protein